MTTHQHTSKPLPPYVQSLAARRLGELTEAVLLAKDGQELERAEFPAGTPVYLEHTSHQIVLDSPESSHEAHIVTFLVEAEAGGFYRYRATDPQLQGA